MTYAQLERTLRPLGFRKKIVASENALIFVHNSTDASVVLTLRPDTAFVHPLDLLTVRKTVVEKGVASLATYEAAARRAKGTHRKARSVRLVRVEGKPYPKLPLSRPKAPLRAAGDNRK